LEVLRGTVEEIFDNRGVAGGSGGVLVVSYQLSVISYQFREQAPRNTALTVRHDSRWRGRPAVGKVVFSNDDGSGTFVRKTLVHFDVEEILKGLDPALVMRWIDPGSLTSSYAEYRRGGRYLVFA
jgi:hypothetical protein